MVIDQDSRAEKEKRFITEYWLLHKFDYSNRGSKHGMNLKYDFGGSKDIAFLDWYYLINSVGKDRPQNVSTAFQCFNLLEETGEISKEELQNLQSSLELILLVKFSLWNVSRTTNNASLLYLNDYSFEICFNDIENLLKKREINNVDELIFFYHQAKAKLHNIVEKLFENISLTHKDSLGLWKIAKDKTELDEEVIEILKNPTWHELVPFAIRSTSPDILQYIVKNYSDKPGFEYILRIISQNTHTTEEIKRELLLSRLDDRFKKKLKDEEISKI